MDRPDRTPSAPPNPMPTTAPTCRAADRSGRPVGPRLSRPTAAGAEAPPARARSRRLALLVLALAMVVVVATGCVGKTGRNDDAVEPGSEGRPRLEIPTRVADPT